MAQSLALLFLIVISSIGITVTSAAPARASSVSDRANNFAKPRLTGRHTTANAATAIDVDTYHNDVSRTGWNSNETTLTPTNAGSLRLIANPALDGLSFTQPLVATGVSINGVNRNLVIVGTNNDSLYAFDANSGALVWKRSFLSAGVTTAGIAFTGCDNTGQQDGILSTPVIDRSTGTIYVISATMEPHHIHFRLHSVALSTGYSTRQNVEIGGSFIAPNGTTENFEPDFVYNRPGLLEADGNIYVAFGSQCDFHLNDYHGWVFAYQVSNFARTGTINVTPTADGNGNYAGGIWMSGEGLSADAFGNIFFSIGNGTFDGGQHNFGDSVVRLSANLSLTGPNGYQFFTPSSVVNDNGNDLDFGSGGVMLLPINSTGARLAVAQGKDGVLTLLNRSNLPGYHAGGPDYALAELNMGGGVWGAPAYWQDASGNPSVFTTGAHLYQVRVGLNSLQIVGQTTMAFPSDNGNGSTPSISSNGSNSVVAWIVQRATAKGGTNYLNAFDALNLGAGPVFRTAIGSWPQNDLNAQLVPTIANGKVYICTENSLAIFGL